MLSPLQIPADIRSAHALAGRSLSYLVSALLVLVLTACQSAPRGQAAFSRVELVDRVPAYGQLVLADISGDEATDIVLMSRQPGRLVWFENPGWQLQQIPLVADALHGVAAYRPPATSGPAGLAINGRFSEPGVGTRQQLRWIQNPGRDVSASAWLESVIRSDAEAGALLWADMTGTGRQVLIAQPGFEAFTFPDRLTRPWGAIPLVTDPLRANRIRVFDWDLDGRDDLLVAGNQGLDIMALASRGVFVDEFNLLTVGSQRTAQSGVMPDTGFLDVGVGQLANPARRFIATLSTDARRLMVFQPGADNGQSWAGDMVADSLISAAVLKVADLNRDGIDEIITGDANGLTVFYFVSEQQHWRSYSVDGSVAIADIEILDLTGSAYPDIVTAPAETGPLVLFQNRL